MYGTLVVKKTNFVHFFACLKFQAHLDINIFLLKNQDFLIFKYQEIPYTMGL